MRWRMLFLIVLFSMVTVMVVLESRPVFAENIDPHDDGSQYAYGENAGWLNVEPLGDGGPGVKVEDSKLTGYIWAENIGWVSLSCENTSSCASVKYGVTNDGNGNLSGYAWAENVGWLSFSCDNTGNCGTVDYGVTIDPATGVFSGKAWAENIGWISFDSTGSTTFGVRTSWRNEQDVVPDDTGGKDGGGGGSVGVCFIATAAYGSSMADDVVILKEFRDSVLLKNSVGRSFVRFYYEVSPPLAEYIKKHESLKTVVRVGLMPLVAISYSTLRFGPIITLTMLLVLLVIPIFLVTFYRMKAPG